MLQDEYTNFIHIVKRGIRKTTISEIVTGRTTIVIQ